MIHPSAKIHPQAIIEHNVKIGERTRVWAFTHILSDVWIGSDCNICDHTFFETGVSLGDRVTIKSGVYVWTGVKIEDDVFVGPSVVFSNDKYPRSRRYPNEYSSTVLQQGCSIGANATILSGITIGRCAMVGAASVVTHDVPDNALVFGNPARMQGWVCSCGKRLIFVDSRADCQCGGQYQLNVDRLIFA